MVAVERTATPRAPQVGRTVQLHRCDVQCCCAQPCDLVQTEPVGSRLHQMRASCMLFVFSGAASLPSNSGAQLCSQVSR